MSYYRQGPMRPGGANIQFGVPGLTPMIKAIMIACGTVWLLQLVLGLAGWPIERLLGLVPASVLRGFVWQPLTYLWLHSPQDPFHLLFNMLFLWMFGSELERHWGSSAFLRFFLVCGVGAGLFVTLLGLLSGEGTKPTIGASGAIFGILTGFGMVFAERTVLFMLIFPMKARTMAIVMAALQFFYVLNQSGGGISYVAHLGGAVVAFLYLKRVWRIGDFYREVRWRLLRRRFKVLPRADDDRWIH